MTGVLLDVMDSSMRTAQPAMIVFTREKEVEPIQRLKVAMAYELEVINMSPVASTAPRLRTRQVMKDNSLHFRY